jgi:hypothetical protein
MRPIGTFQIQHAIEAADVPSLKTQSPSTSDGDCALRLSTPVASKQRSCWARHLASWTVAATGGRIGSLLS